MATQKSAKYQLDYGLAYDRQTGIIFGFPENAINISEKAKTPFLMEKEYPTHSTYRGTWSLVGNGHGTFVFPSKAVTYEGSFEDGSFHGEGHLTYDNGLILKGQWAKGHMKERKIVFPDGLEFNEVDWNYLCATDRRYTVEYDFGMEPAGRSYITPERPPIAIPPGYFDCGDGFYEPKTNCVYKYNDLTSILRFPKFDEQEWIKRTCRKNPDGYVGPCTFFYEAGFVPPKLELQPPPPPAARTKRYLSDSSGEVEDFYEDEDQHWRRLRFSRASRASTASDWRQRFQFKFDP